VSAAALGQAADGAFRFFADFSMQLRPIRRLQLRLMPKCMNESEQNTSGPGKANLRLVVSHDADNAELFENLVATIESSVLVSRNRIGDPWQNELFLQ
jgi:hypothetical protein